MSLRIRRTVAARADIRAITRFIARDSINAALKWADDVDEKLKILSEIPGTGTDRGYLRKGLRSSPFGSYVVYFEVDGRDLVVVAILHGAQKHEKRFKN